MPNTTPHTTRQLDATCPACAGAVDHGVRAEPGTEQLWLDTAAQFSRNADYYRGLVVEIGRMLGHVAYVSDDGSVQQDVLCAKVPELVRAALASARPQGAEADQSTVDRITDAVSDALTDFALAAMAIGAEGKVRRDNVPAVREAVADALDPVMVAMCAFVDEFGEAVIRAERARAFAAGTPAPALLGERSEAWWMERADREGDQDVSAGAPAPAPVGEELRGVIPVNLRHMERPTIRDLLRDAILTRTGRFTPGGGMVVQLHAEELEAIRDFVARAAGAPARGAEGVDDA